MDPSFAAQHRYAEMHDPSTVPPAFGAPMLGHLAGAPIIGGPGCMPPGISYGPPPTLLPPVMAGPPQHQHPHPMLPQQLSVVPQGAVEEMGGSRDGMASRRADLRPTNVGARNLYIHNVSKDAREEDVKEFFSHCGEVESVALRVNQRVGPNAVYAFVLYKRPEDARACFDTLNGKVLLGRSIRVEYQRGKPTAAARAEEGRSGRGLRSRDWEGRKDRGQKEARSFEEKRVYRSPSPAHRNDWNENATQDGEQRFESNAGGHAAQREDLCLTPLLQQHRPHLHIPSLAAKCRDGGDGKHGAQLLHGNTPELQDSKANTNDTVRSSWTWLLGRNDRKRLGVVVSCLQGDVATSLQQLQCLLNVSHRSKFEELSQKPITAALLMQPINNDNHTAFAEYLSYFQSKERAGVASLPGNYYLYLVPSGCSVFAKYRELFPLQLQASRNVMLGLIGPQQSSSTAQQEVQQQQPQKQKQRSYQQQTPAQVQAVASTQWAQPPQPQHGVQQPKMQPPAQQTLHHQHSVQQLPPMHHPQSIQLQQQQIIQQQGSLQSAPMNQMSSPPHPTRGNLALQPWQQHVQLDHGQQQKTQRTHVQQQSIHQKHTQQPLVQHHLQTQEVHSGNQHGSQLQWQQQQPWQQQTLTQQVQPEPWQSNSAQRQLNADSQQQPVVHQRGGGVSSGDVPRTEVGGVNWIQQLSNMAAFLSAKK